MWGIEAKRPWEVGEVKFYGDAPWESCNPEAAAAVSLITYILRTKAFIMAVHENFIGIVNFIFMYLMILTLAFVLYFIYLLSVCWNVNVVALHSMVVRKFTWQSRWLDYISCCLYFWFSFAHLKSFCNGHWQRRKKEDKMEKYTHLKTSKLSSSLILSQVVVKKL